MRKWKYAKHAKNLRRCDGCRKVLSPEEALFCERCFLDALEEEMYLPMEDLEERDDEDD